MAMKSENVAVRTIINVCIEGFHSVMGRNLTRKSAKLLLTFYALVEF